MQSGSTRSFQRSSVVGASRTGFRAGAIVAAFTLLLHTLHSASAATQVGAYYYPWYGSFPGGHGWNETLRARLVPQQPPALGYYNSRSSAAIQAHIDQSHRGNISFWATSWWGPNSAEDQTTRNYILANPRAGELRYAIHYESTGRLGTFENPSYSNLVPDFQFLNQNYFNNANYLRIDGRPVVFIYLTRAYFNTQTARDAVANLRQTMQSQYGVNPYLIGDDVFPGQTNAQRAALWDAITDFDVYGSALQANGSTTAGVSALAEQFQSARQMAQSLNVGFIPSVSPGFNDSAVRSGHPAAPRYLTDVPGADEGSLFIALLDQAVLPNLDPATGNLLMVSTFNEWHEDTQIEPTIFAAPTTTDDSGFGTFTQGYSYSGYGDLYLNQLRQATVPEPAAGLVTTLMLLMRRKKARAHPLVKPLKVYRAASEILEPRRLLSFTVGGDSALSGYASSVVTADFNGDGRADFAVATTSSDRITVLLGNANGTFAAGPQLTAWPPSSLEVGDVNGDGKLDLVTGVVPFGTGGNTPYVQIFPGNGNGTFAPRQFVSVPPPPNPPSTFNNNVYTWAVTVADFNADGKGDLVASCQYEYYGTDYDPDSPYPPPIYVGHYLSVLRANGDGTFTTAFVHEVVTGGDPVSDIEAGDLNGDGKLDLVWGAWSYSTINVLLGVGNGTFSVGPSYYWPQAIIDGDAGLALADYNADGKLDVAAAGHSVTVGYGNGSGGFATPVTFDGGPTRSRSLATADFNLDGRPDLVAANFGGYPPGASAPVDGKVSVLLNNGAGGFAAPLVLGCGPNNSYAQPFGAAADYNGDGRPDIAATSCSIPPSPDPTLANVRLLINDGNFGGKTWIGPASGGNWSTPANWSPAGVPSASDVVVISAADVELSGTAVVAGLSLTGGAMLNLKNHDLVINYSGGSPIGSWNGSAYTGVTGMIAAGSLFTSLSNAGPGVRTLGVGDDGESVIVKYTYAGDIDLDGDVDGDDYFIIDSHVAQSGVVFGYGVGDIDLDGDIDGDDYFWLDGNIHAQGPPL